MKIKVFLFDLGNVILPFDHYISAKKISKYTEKSPEDIYNIFFDSPVTNQFEEGKISPFKFYNCLKATLFLNNLDYKGFVSIWSDIFKEDRKMLQLIKILKRKFKVFIISNINELHFKYIKEKFSIINEVDGVILSFKVGVRKPDSKIYQVGIKYAKCLPEEIIYIDDRLELIEEAKELGLNCIHYTGYRLLIKELKKFNISDTRIFHCTCSNPNVPNQERNK